MNLNFYNTNVKDKNTQVITNTFVCLNIELDWYNFIFAEMPVVQLKFPDELREGLWGLNIGCSATLGAAGALTLMRKRPGEIDFAPFEPQVKNPRELRINETIDPEFPCIKDVLYEFDANLDGWNMTEILCAIDEGKDSEMLSDIGVFKIVPRE